MDIPEGVKVKITLDHGDNERFLTGTTRSFQQDGETRWELIDADEDRTHMAAYEPQLQHQHFDAIGFVPENVTALETVKD